MTEQILIQRDALQEENEALRAENARLREALAKCLPFIKEMQAENFEDRDVGIYYDHDLEAAFVSTEQALADTPPRISSGQKQKSWA